MVGSSAMMLGPPIGVPSSMGNKDRSGLGVDATHPGGERSFEVGLAPSYVEVVSSAERFSNKELLVANGFLGQRADFTFPMRGPDSVPMEVRSAVNYYDLEKKLLDPLGKYQRVAEGDTNFLGNPLGNDPSDAQQWSSALGNNVCPDGDADFGVDIQHGKEMILSLLGAWKSHLVRPKAEIGRVLGDLLEGLKGFGFGFGLSQMLKHVGRHKGGWRWASKSKPKIQR